MAANSTDAPKNSTSAQRMVSRSTSVRVAPTEERTLARRLRITLLLGALAAMAAMAPPAAAQAPVVQTVFATFNVPRGEIGSFSVNCPPGFTATAGAIVANDNSLPVLRTGPLGSSRWHFAFSNQGGFFTQDAQVRVSVTCVRIRRRGARVRLRTQRIKVGVLVPPQQQRRVVGTCPPGQAPTGQGAETDDAPPPPPPGGGNARASDFGQVGQFIVHEARPIRGGFAFLFENRSSTPAEVTANVVCIARQVVARARGPASRRRRRSRRRNVIRARVVTAELNQGNNDNIVVPCPAGHGALSAGHAIAPDSNASLFRSWAEARRGGLFSIVAPNEGTRVTLAALCLDLRQRWTPFR
jgi:hypothetical protein